MQPPGGNGNSDSMVLTTMSATPGLLWLIMPNASAHDAQEAAAAHLVADLNPNTPILIGRMASFRAKFQDLL